MPADGVNGWSPDRRCPHGAHVCESCERQDLALVAQLAALTTDRSRLRALVGELMEALDAAAFDDIAEPLPAIAVSALLDKARAALEEIR
jgi:hypothetical protein